MLWNIIFCKTLGNQFHDTFQETKICISLTPIILLGRPNIFIVIKKAYYKTCTFFCAIFRHLSFCDCTTWSTVEEVAWTLIAIEQNKVLNQCLYQVYWQRHQVGRQQKMGKSLLLVSDVETLSFRIGGRILRIQSKRFT